MASGTFGTPITEATLRATGEYPEPITQKDCAHYAQKMMSAGDKDVNAARYVDNLKEKYGNGITSKCLIYNATGTTLKFVDHRDWEGSTYENPPPSLIQNGQWGAFIHVHPSAQAVGSFGAVVYRCDSGPCDFLFCWGIPYIGGNKVYTEIREEGHFPHHWDYIYNVKVNSAGTHSVDNVYGYKSDTTIGDGTTVQARAIFSYP